VGNVYYTCNGCGHKTTSVALSGKCDRCGYKEFTKNQDKPKEKNMTQTAVAVKTDCGSFAVSDIENMAKRMVASKLFGVQNVDQAVSLMLIAQAEGMHPAIAARDYHIIQGRHTLKADAMLARFQQSGGKVEWHEYTDEKCVGIFSHPQSPTPISVEWDMDRATRAGIGGKDNWKKYPRQMLKARVVSDGVRLCFPGCAVGVYTPEEVQDFDTTTSPQPATVVEQPKTPAMTDMNDLPLIKELGDMLLEIKDNNKFAAGAKLKKECGIPTLKGITKEKLSEVEPIIRDLYKTFMADDAFKVDCPNGFDPKSMDDCDKCDKRKDCPAH
jgi:DNA-directed RNA polymerase subunit RPC12/RpoP